MKKLITIILVIISENAFSQKMLVLPDTPRFANQNKGAWVLRLADTSAWYSNGTRWVRSLNTNDLTGINFDSTSLSNRVNLKLNISDTANMLVNYLKSVNKTYGLSGSGTTLNPLSVDTTSVNGLVSKTRLNNGLNLKQDLLVSGTNIKTVNGNSLLGSGDIAFNKTNIFSANTMRETLIDLDFITDTTAYTRFSKTLGNVAIAFNQPTGAVITETTPNTTLISNVLSGSTIANRNANILIDTVYGTVAGIAANHTYEGRIIFSPNQKTSTPTIIGFGLTGNASFGGYALGSWDYQLLAVLTNDPATSGFQNWQNGSGNGAAVAYTFKKWGFDYSVSDSIELYQRVDNYYDYYIRITNLTTGKYLDTTIIGGMYVGNLSKDWHQPVTFNRFTIYTHTGGITLKKYQINAGRKSGYDALILGNSIVTGNSSYVQNRAYQFEQIFQDSCNLKVKAYSGGAGYLVDFENSIKDIMLAYKPKTVILQGLYLLDAWSNGQVFTKAAYKALVAKFKSYGVKVIHTSSTPQTFIDNATQVDYINWIKSEPDFAGDAYVELKASIENPASLGTMLPIYGAEGSGTHPNFLGIKKIVSTYKAALPLMFKTGNLYSLETNPLVVKTIAVFGGGGGNAGDTTTFNTSTVYGSFYNSGTDSLVITSMIGVLQGSSPDITYKVFYNDSLNVEAGATALVTAGSALTNTTTGTTVSSFNMSKIPPNVWVWVKTSTVTTKPKYFSLSLIGYKKKI